MMDIKTKLKDEPLFMSGKGTIENVQMLNYLEERGITTIEDLIYYTPTYFENFGLEVYNAMIEVYKHEYLGEPLVTDVLFDKEYEHSDDGYWECSQDIERLGLRGVFRSVFEELRPYYCIVDFFEADLEKCRCHMKIYPYKGTYDKWEAVPSEKYKGKKFKIEQLLHDGVIGRKSIDLAGYYLRYIEQKRKEQQANIGLDDSATLSDLKKQLQSLLEMINNFDTQISSIQESIESIEKGESGNARKRKVYPGNKRTN